MSVTQANLNVLLFLNAPPGGREDRAEDSRVQRGLPSHRQALLHPVLQHRRPGQHRAHVPVLTELVPTPLCQLHPGQVDYPCSSTLTSTGQVE